MSYKVKNYMRRDFSTIDVNDSAFEASRIMSDRREGCIIVLDKGRPVGIVTERDLVSKVMAKGVNPMDVKVAEIMSSPLITIDPDASVEEAVEVIVKNGIRRLPVVRDGIIYGVFTTRDLAKHFNEYEEVVVRSIIRAMSLLSIPF